MFSGDIEEILFDSDAIQRRVAEMARRISEDYAGKPVIAVGILKGAFIFLSDLARSLRCLASFDFMGVSSYGASTSSSGVVRITKDLEESIEGRHVLIVEDVVDTGLTLRYLCEALKARKPASLKVCCLLDKPSRRKVPVTLDYVGFEIPDAFVVGYGLDYNEKYRQLPFICVLKPEVYSPTGGKAGVE
ncbi:MAG: hypoxanthine phosphoribosyltransferase [Firmicutes bacterium]|nr:hypoxanthine phosphoribosyltransferase [Bacillota bacterium]